MGDSCEGPLHLSWTDEHDVFNLFQVDTQSDKILTYTEYRYLREDNNFANMYSVDSH